MVSLDQPPPALAETPSPAQQAAKKLADLLHQIEQRAEELVALRGSVRFSLVYVVTVQNGPEATHYNSSSLLDALIEAERDIEALHGLGRLTSSPIDEPRSGSASPDGSPSPATSEP